MNKYDRLPLAPLIVEIQSLAMQLGERKLLKQGSSRTYIKRSMELSAMRESAARRLQQLDRRDKSFFPVGIVVTYRPWERAAPVQARVIGHAEHENRVVIKIPDTLEDGVVVSPDSLKLAFIRPTY